MSATINEYGKRPRSRLSGSYGHPTHPILVTVPIGAWTASLVFDVASHVVHQPGFLAHGAVWLIAIGILGALAAAVAGFLDLLLIPTQTPAFRTALLHMTLNLAVVFAYVGNFAWREANHDTTSAVPIGPIGLSVLSLVVLGASGFLGGKLAYRYGVRVASESIQAGGFASGTPAGRRADTRGANSAPESVLKRPAHPSRTTRSTPPAAAPQPDTNRSA